VRGAYARRHRDGSLDRIWDVEEYVAQVEALGKVLTETLDAERLGRVVAGRDEVQAELASLGHAPLSRLARDKGPGTGRRRVAEVVGAAP
jgi:hypothetical protein